MDEPAEDRIVLTVDFIRHLCYTAFDADHLLDKVLNKQPRGEALRDLCKSLRDLERSMEGFVADWPEEDQLGVACRDIASNLDRISDPLRVDIEEGRLILCFPKSGL